MEYAGRGGSRRRSERRDGIPCALPPSERQVHFHSECRMNKPTAHCSFCDIIHGAAEVSMCYEDTEALAFMDIQPVNAGHILVVPRQHYESLVDIPPRLAMHLFNVAMHLEGIMRKVTGCRDTNLVVNSGYSAGQDVFHYHVHVIPRRKGDGFDIPLPFGGSEMPDRQRLDAMAARIIAALRDPLRGGGSIVEEEEHVEAVA